MANSVILFLMIINLKFIAVKYKTNIGKEKPKNEEKIN